MLSFDKFTSIGSRVRLVTLMSLKLHITIGKKVTQHLPYTYSTKVFAADAVSNR